MYINATMAELAYAADLKSATLTGIRVRPPVVALENNYE